MKSIMNNLFCFGRMDCAQDVLQITEEEGTYSLFDVAESEIFFEKDMKCPVPGCNVQSLFPTQAKFLRHWEERHVSQTVKHECIVKTCRQLCSRKSDMKHHLKQKHRESDDVRIGELLKKCPRRVVETTNYIDPIFYSYNGRKAQASQPKPTEKPVFIQLTTPEVEPSPIVKSVVIPVNTAATSLTSPPPPTPTAAMPQNSTTSTATTYTESPMVTDVFFPVHEVNEDNTDFTVHLSEKAKLSVEEYRARSKPFTPILSATAVAMQTENTVRNVVQMPTLPVLPMFSNKMDKETQTRVMDMAVDDLYLPPIPNTIPELEEFLRYLCNTLDRIGRVRESAKQQLEKLRVTEPSIEAERLERKRLESENKALKRELAELKWRKEVFGASEL